MSNLRKYKIINGSKTIQPIQSSVSSNLIHLINKLQREMSIQAARQTTILKESLIHKLRTMEISAKE
jgi:hypothetical protein